MSTLAAVRELARRAMRQSYALTKWRSFRHMQRGHGTPVVVFSMAKTGSSALYRAVAGAVSNPRFHIHLLAPDTVARTESHYRQTDKRARPTHVWQSQFLGQRLPTPEAPWNVVTAVREPVARSVSEFFQSGGRLGLLHDPSTTMSLYERFATRQGIPHTLRWFDTEFKECLGVDVYEYPFDPARGYTIIETPAVRVLVLRQESLEVAGRALGEFLGLAHEVEIVKVNVGSDKDYSELYAEVASEVRVSKKMLDRAYSSRFCGHFYSPEEIAAFRRSWQ